MLSVMLLVMLSVTAHVPALFAEPPSGPEIVGLACHLAHLSHRGHTSIRPPRAVP